ncbi:hypothetical protein [Mycobacterium paraintracellulare]
MVVIALISDALQARQGGNWPGLQLFSGFDWLEGGVYFVQIEPY